MKLVLRVLKRVRQINFPMKKEVFAGLILIYFFLIFIELFSQYKHKKEVSKAQVQSQILSTYQLVKDKFDMSHMHIALDYSVTQTISDSIENLHVPSMLGILLKDKNNELLYTLGQVDKIPKYDFVAHSGDSGNKIYLKIPIFTKLNKYEVAISIENQFNASVIFYPGEVKPKIKILNIVDLKMILYSLIRSTFFIILLILIILIWSSWVGFGQILHDQGQYKFLYSTLISKIEELSSDSKNKDKIKEATDTIHFLSSLDRLSASKEKSEANLDLVQFMSIIHRAYKWNFEKIEFTSNVDKYLVRLNKDALAAILTNSLHNAFAYVGKLAPSHNPNINICLIVDSRDISIIISNTFKSRDKMQKQGLGTSSVDTICHNNNWALHRKAIGDRFSVLLSIPHNV